MADLQMNNPHSTFHLSHSKGFTLVEIIIVIVLISIIAGIAAMILLQGVRGYSDQTQRSSLHYQARLAVERMTREARLIWSCGDITGPVNPSNTLRFTDVFGNPVVFSVAGTTLSRGGSLLANNITSPTPFRFLNKAGNATTTCVSPNDIWFVEIDLTATDTQGSETLRIRTRVHPMNFQ